MSNLLKGGPRLVRGEPFRLALQRGQRAYFHDRPGTRVAFLVPLGACGIQAFDAPTESFARGQAKYGDTVGVSVELARHAQRDMVVVIRRLADSGLMDGIILGEPVPDASELPIMPIFRPT